MQRDNFQCVKCGNRPPGIRLEVDHILPWSRGGTDVESNLQTFCDKCNAGKSNQYELLPNNHIQKTGADSACQGHATLPAPDMERSKDRTVASENRPGMN
jgi:hypothetical protein